MLPFLATLRSDSAWRTSTRREGRFMRHPTIDRRGRAAERGCPDRRSVARWAAHGLVQDPRSAGPRFHAALAPQVPMAVPDRLPASFDTDAGDVPIDVEEPKG